MKNCPICGTETRDDARYCRSCYAVFADLDQAGATKAPKPRVMTYVLRGLIILGIAGGAWLYRIDLAIFPDSAPTDASASAPSIGGPRKKAESAGAPAAASSSSVADEDVKWGRPVNTVTASSVQRHGIRCAISQAVHNGGERIMFPVALDFMFENAIGQRIGDNARAEVEAILPAGERRGFTFEMPCPRSFAQVEIHTTDRHAGISGGGSVEDIAKMMAGQPQVDPRQLHVALQAPDNLIVCPELRPCQLMMYFNESWIAVWFRRDPNNPDMLIASDPELVSPLQRGWNVEVQLPLRNGVEKLTVTQEFLRKPQRTWGWAGLMASVANMLGNEEKDH